jgi:hypothetical protein
MRVRNAYKIWAGRPQEKIILGKPRWEEDKRGKNVWIGVTWLRIWTGCWLLGTRQ